MPRLPSSPSSGGRSEDESHDGSVGSDSNDSMTAKPATGRTQKDCEIRSEGSAEEYDSIPAAITSDLLNGDSQQSDDAEGYLPKSTAATPVPKKQSVKRKRGRPPGSKPKANALPKSGGGDPDGDGVHRRSLRVEAQAKDRVGKIPARSVGRLRRSGTQAKPAQTAEQKGKKSPRAGKAPSATQETEWEVERIVDARGDTVTSEVLYLVKWKGYPAKYNTWEPMENLANCKRAIKAFDAEQEAPTKKPKRRV